MTHAITKTTTKLRLLWDRQYLYFLAELEDHDLFADILEHDGKTWNNDVFELFFWPDSKSPGYYELQVNAAGTMMDVFFPDRESVDFDKRKSADQFDWKTKVQRKGTLDNRTDRDEGWVVEGRIPWNDLIKTGGRPEVDKIWKVAFCRYDYTLGKDPELSSCARLSQVNFHLLADYANLRFAGPEESDSRRK
ncbi:MAG: hypothetical protein FJ267_01380 [Planctomycetes bacterium]|nr:hypothetical protein [Planctomycetota bacterium]